MGSSPGRLGAQSGHQEDTRGANRHNPADRLPELPTFLTLRGAQELAARRIANPADQERFVALVREAMESSIKKGEPLPNVRMNERADQKPPSPRKDEPTR